ncbi:hypothetical protein BAE44_0012917 [Dichanthelium oligosanthes]|uniref:DUF8039 domain-containing protein n=1 Tax=Dichanthelium oligosanthes TaxID=888268 RepID=A0A1E5VLS3_9POAL|nr:hypothetical protein BAE44_0012917 [Dichanthelium oligosanthes]
MNKDLLRLEHEAAPPEKESPSSYLSLEEDNNAQAWPIKEGMQLHGHAIPRGYAKVSIDKILKKKYNKILLDHPPEKDKQTLGDNKNGFVPWHKCYTNIEAHQYKLNKKTHIAFLDPMIINENTCKGINGDPNDTVTRLAKLLQECEYKESILLVYNYEDVFP